MRKSIGSATRRAPSWPSVALVLALGLSACAGQSPLEAMAAYHPGDAVPAWKVASAKSKADVDSATYKGKPLYINFFASWCGPCNDEAPDVSKLYAKYRAKGLNVLGVDEMEDAGKANAFAKKYKWAFPIAHDDDGSLAKIFGAIALPVHVFIGRDGKISTYRLGQMTDADIDAAMQKATS